MIMGIPKEESLRRYKICENCKLKKSYTDIYGYDIGWLDCPYDCPNDYEHFKKEYEMSKEDKKKKEVTAVIKANIYAIYEIDEDEDPLTVEELNQIFKAAMEGDGDFEFDDIEAIKVKNFIHEH